MTPRQGIQFATVCALAGPGLGCGSGAGPAGTPHATTAQAVAPQRDERPKADWYAQHHSMATQSCGEGCRYGTHQHSEVKMLLGPHGDATVVDHGERLEETATVVGKNGRLTRWVRRWQGSWSEGQGRIKVTLTPESLECERDTRDGSHDSPCSATQLELVCERATVSVSDPKPLQLPGWVCIPERPVRLSELTPLPWVFGADQWLLALERGNDPRQSRSLRQYAVGDLSEYPRPMKSAPQAAR